MSRTSGLNYNTAATTTDSIRNIPKMPFFGSETASTLTTRGEYADDRPRAYVTSYNMTDGSWKPVAERPCVPAASSGPASTTKASRRPTAGRASTRHFGIIDMCGFPKDNYYYYQLLVENEARRPPDAALELARQGGEKYPRRRVQQLRARGTFPQRPESRCERTMPRNGHLDWEVKFEPGTLWRKATTPNGKITATDSDETTGAAGRPAAEHRPHRTYRRRRRPVAGEVDVLDAQGSGRTDCRQPREVQGDRRGPRPGSATATPAIMIPTRSTIATPSTAYASSSSAPTRSRATSN